MRQLDSADGGPRPHEGLLVALSGGLDSVVLARLLARLARPTDQPTDQVEGRPLRLELAHLDHALRPESSADAEFCRALAAELHLPIHIERRTPDPEDLAYGPEAAARRLRHRFLEECRDRQGLDTLAFAHHLDDQEETQWMRLLRGSGPSALAGMSAREDGKIRPLLGFRRQEIRQLAQSEGWTWREDSTNQELGFARNRLRRETLPALVREWGEGVRGRPGALASRLAEDSRALDQLAAAALDSLVEEREGCQLWIPRHAFLAQPRALRQRQILLLAARLDADRPHQRWNARTLSELQDFLERSQSGQRRDLPGGSLLGVERDNIWLCRDRPPATPLVEMPQLEQRFLPGPAGMLKLDAYGSSSSDLGSGWSPESAYSVLVDADRLLFPLELRPARAGDRIALPEIGGHKKLVRLYAERALPREARAEELVVSDQKGIIWAVGSALAGPVRPRPSTTRLLELNIRAESRTKD